MPPNSTSYWSASTPTPVTMPMASVMRNFFRMWPTVSPLSLSLTWKSTSWQPQGQPQQMSEQSQQPWLISSLGSPLASLMSKVMLQQAKGSIREPMSWLVFAFVTKTSGLWKQQQVHLKGRSMCTKGCGGWPSPVSSAMSKLKGRASPSKSCLPTAPKTPSCFSAATKRSLPESGSESMYLFGISQPTRTSMSWTFSLILTVSSLERTAQGSSLPLYLIWYCPGAQTAPAVAMGMATGAARGTAMACCGGRGA
mmetsp:Transcript_85448/g.242264  ORF Transcript_85448/g.242264 Transcript_85448/m.242264 type:complete len:253 (+) Transcript_85448:311-1069(+)